MAFYWEREQLIQKTGRVSKDREYLNTIKQQDLNGSQNTPPNSRTYILYKYPQNIYQNRSYPGPWKNFQKIKKN